MNFKINLHIKLGFTGLLLINKRTPYVAGYSEVYIIKIFYVQYSKMGHLLLIFN